MSRDMDSRYAALLDSFEKCASAFAALRLVILHEDASIAADMASVCESFAAGVLNHHNLHANKEGESHERIQTI
jgi:hypothetical protein